VKISTVTYLVILAGAILWCAAFVLPPVLVSAEGAWSVVGIALYQPFRTICHQLPERSLHILGAQLAVCMRCSAIYVGFLFGTIFYLPIGKRGQSISDKRALLMASVLLMVLDVVLDEFGIHASTDATRLITGSLFGIVVPFYIIPAAQEAVQELVAASRFLTSSDVKKGSIHA
jgi:uncharacterized membrane protein